MNAKKILNTYKLAMNIIVLVLNIVKILQIHHIPVINMLVAKIHQDVQTHHHQFIIKTMMVNISIQTIVIVAKLLNIIEHLMMEINVYLIVVKDMFGYLKIILKHVIKVHVQIFQQKLVHSVN